MLKKIISGGQTGADVGGLQAGNKSRIPTGGRAPLNWRTENGPNPKLGSQYGLTKTKAWSYPPRTRLNVRQSDATLWVGHSNTAGGKLTLRTCRKFDKPVMKIPFDRNGEKATTKDVASRLCYWMQRHQVKVLNVAGNRESTNIGIQGFTERILMLAICEWKDPGYLEREILVSNKERRHIKRLKKMKAKLLRQQSLQGTKKKRRRLPRRRLPKKITETGFR